MTALAIVLLILGFLFATLQYPALMRGFWKWTLIGVGSVALLALVIASAIIAIDTNKQNEAELPDDVIWPDKSNNAKLPAPNPFDQFDGKPNDWVSPEQAAQHGPWEAHKPQRWQDAPIVVKPEYYGADGRRIAKPPEDRQNGNSVEDRINQALSRAADQR